jgi:hypothetical protein
MLRDYPILNKHGEGAKFGVHTVGVSFYLAQGRWSDRQGHKWWEVHNQVSLHLLTAVTHS